MFDWVPDTNEPPPASVVVRKEVFAQAAIDSKGTVNGQPVYDGSVEAKSGFEPGYEDRDDSGDNHYRRVHAVKYEVQQGGWEVSVTMSPSATATTNVPANLPMCKADTTVYTFAAVMPYQPLTVQVSLSGAAVKGLTFDATNHRQSATYPVTATVTGAPAGSTIYYNWTSTGPLGTLDYDNARANSTTARTSGPGKFYPQCTAVAVINGVYYSGSDAKVCAANGGPITTTIKRPTQNGTKVYEHDRNDPTKPFYLTKFGYSNATGPTGLDQPTQGATLQVMDQPPGTTITWSMPASTYSPVASIHSTKTDVYAEGDFSNGVPQAQFVFSGDGISGSSYDDSSTTQASRTVGGTTTWAPLVYQISGHRPLKLQDLPAGTDATVAVATYPAPSNATAWTNYTYYTYQLIDGALDPMPGVWIQERFVTPLPSGFNHNSMNKFWVTTSPFTLNGGSPNVRDGFFNAPDQLYAYWTDASPAPINVTHVYYAGNHDPTATATTGVPLGAYNMSYVPGTPGAANIQTFHPGDPGTASQSKSS